MRVLCPTCHGVGRIAQPMPPGTVMMYCGPNGENWPMICCQTCCGSGWIENGVYGVPAPGDPQVRPLPAWSPSQGTMTTTTTLPTGWYIYKP